MVTDAKGVDRVIIGAPLPDAVIHGREFKQGGAVAGITVLDAKGGGPFSNFDGNKNLDRLGVFEGRPTLIVREKGARSSNNLLPGDADSKSRAFATVIDGDF